jgi:hypothetical protein
MNDQEGLRRDSLDQCPTAIRLHAVSHNQGRVSACEQH